MGLLDIFTGGKSDKALDALRRAEGYFSSLQTPTADQLTLPQLREYVEAGIMTPEEAEAYLQDYNAFNDLNIDQTGTAAQIDALNQLRAIANAGPEGTPLQQAQMANTLSQLNTQTGGQRGAIEQAMAARGTPYALIQAALANQYAGQDAQQAHLDSVNSQAAAYQAAVNAMAQGGALGGQLQGQQNQQANTVAGAQNAMQQFNAQNQQQNSQFNAANRQSANAMNAANKQQVSNNNTGLANARTEYNAKVPQQVFDNNLKKAMGQSGAATNIGNMQQQQGQQNAGIIAGLINTGSSFIPNPNQKIPNAAHGGYVDENGRMCYDEGGVIPGEPMVPGDSLLNDNVPVNVSPGEAIISRETVASNPEIVGNLLDENMESQIDFKDVGLLLKALRAIRVGAI